MPHFNADILDEYAKEEEENEKEEEEEEKNEKEEEEEEKKKKTTDCPTFQKILQKYSGEHLFSISLMYLMIVSGFNNACCFYFLRAALGERSIRIDRL